MMEFCALSHGESARHIAQTPVFGKCSLSVARDGSFSLADQLGEASLAVDQRQVAQLSPSCSIRSGRTGTAALASQRMEVQYPVIAGDHDLAVDQERLCLEAGGGFDKSQEVVRPVMAVECEAADARAIPAHHALPSVSSACIRIAHFAACRNRSRLHNVPAATDVVMSLNKALLSALSSWYSGPLRGTGLPLTRGPNRSHGPSLGPAPWQRSRQPLPRPEAHCG